MKITVKTLTNSHFNIDVNPHQTVADVKQMIETAQGSNVYPASQQMLIHQGKVLNDETTLEENKVADNGFIVVMLKKSKSSSGEGSTAAAPVSKAPSSRTRPASVPESPTPLTPVTNESLPGTTQAPAPVPDPDLAVTPASQSASNLLVGSDLEPTIQHILDMGGGTWDRDTVVRALHAAYNNPERAVEYLYSGIPEQAEVLPAGVVQPTNASSAPQQPTQTASVTPGGPNANPINLFPEGFPNLGSDGGASGPMVLDFLRQSEQFQALRAVVQTNPEVLQPMLQELGKQNPNLLRLIQEHQDDFLQLINEPIDGEEGNILGQLDAAMPQAIEVTPEEQEAIQRLEALGFDRAAVLEVYFACNKNEELAANYLIDHMHELDD